MKEQKAHWLFMEEVKHINEANLRPVTSSKIPIGKFRVEAERDQGSSMLAEISESGAIDSNLNNRCSSPPPISKIPMGDWRNKTTAYKNLIEKHEKKEFDYSFEKNKRPTCKINNYKEVNSNEDFSSNDLYKSGTQSDLQNSRKFMKPKITINGYNYARTGREGLKIPSMVPKQRSRSEGPSRNGVRP